MDWRRWAAACLLRWHLCSLDAPTVAVTWAVALARPAGVRLRWQEGLVLGLGTWIVYVLDRVLDGAGTLASSQAGIASADFRERHQFHRRHRRLLLRLCGVAGCVLALLCGQLSSRLVAFYLMLGAPVLVYAACVHWRLLRKPFSAPRAASTDHGPHGKEAAVALLFTAAVAAPAWVGAEAASRGQLTVAVVLLAWLCWLNCRLISHAEASGSTRGPNSRRPEQLGLAALAIGLACAAGALVLVQPGSARWSVQSSPADAVATLSPALLPTLLPPLLPVLFSVGLSALLLLALLLIPCSARRLRVLADLGLLTPLLFLFARGA